MPLFVTKCIAEIEKGDLLQTDGVYRQSGNLSTVQKIRLQVRDRGLPKSKSTQPMSRLCTY